MKSITENNIQNYISNIDFNNSEWTVKEIKENIKRMTGETPAVKVNYSKDVRINEINSTAEEFKKLKSIEIIFTDLNDKLKRVEYLLDAKP